MHPYIYIYITFEFLLLLLSVLSNPFASYIFPCGLYKKIYLKLKAGSFLFEYSNKTKHITDSKSQRYDYDIVRACERVDAILVIYYIPPNRIANLRTEPVGTCL
jgi:hypothetical protein